MTADTRPRCLKGRIVEEGHVRFCLKHKGHADEHQTVFRGRLHRWLTQ